MTCLHFAGPILLSIGLFLGSTPLGARDLIPEEVVFEAEVAQPPIMVVPILAARGCRPSPLPGDNSQLCCNGREGPGGPPDGTCGGNPGGWVGYLCDGVVSSLSGVCGPSFVVGIHERNPCGPGQRACFSIFVLCPGDGTNPAESLHGEDPAAFDWWVAQLDSNVFAERENASANLGNLCGREIIATSLLIEGLLRGNTISLEQRWRLERILQNCTQCIQPARPI
jgi:hypothetical protein